MEEKPFHIELLQQEILKRKSTNPRYSMRAFSRHLGLGPSTLSRILSYNQDLSLSASRKIIKKLKLSPEDRRLFIASIAEEKKQRTLLSLASEDVEYLSSFEETIKSSRDMIFILDQSCRCVHANESASRLFSLNTNQMLGRTLDQLGVDQVLAEKINESAEGVWERGELDVVDSRYECFDSLTFEIVLMPIMNDEGEVMGLACHWRDITETVVMEDYLSILHDAGLMLSQSLQYQQGLKDVESLLCEDFCEAVIIKTFHDESLYISGDKTLLENFHQIFPLDKKTNPDFVHVLANRQPYKMNHLDKVTFSISRTRPHELGSFICLPLSCREQTFGVMALLRTYDGDAFTSRDEEFAIDLALRMAETIDYCLLFERCHD